LTWVNEAAAAVDQMFVLASKGRPMIDNGTISRVPAQTVSSACSTPSRPTAHSDMRADLLSDCDRIAHIWSDRCRADAALWSALAEELTKATTLADARAIYSACAAERMRMATENARRIFEEYQAMMQKYSAASDGRSDNEESVADAA
jgi:hypothetical protein